MCREYGKWKTSIVLSSIVTGLERKWNIYFWSIPFSEFSKISSVVLSCFHTFILVLLCYQAWYAAIKMTLPFEKGLINLLPPNIRLDEDVLKTSWRRLSSSSSEDVLIKSNISSWPYVFKTFSRPLQDVFKASSGHLQDVFKMSSRPFEDAFKTSSRHLQNVLPRGL